MTLCPDNNSHVKPAVLVARGGGERRAVPHREIVPIVDNNLDQPRSSPYAMDNGDSLPLTGEPPSLLDHPPRARQCNRGNKPFRRGRTWSLA